MYILNFELQSLQGCTDTKQVSLMFYYFYFITILWVVAGMVILVDKYMNQYFSQDQILSLSQENKIARLRSRVITWRGLGDICFLIQAVLSSTAIKFIKLSS